MNHLSLHAVTLVVPDYDVALGFFTNVLGFDCVSDEDQGNGKRWVMVRPPDGGTALLLAKAVNEKQIAAIGNQTGGRVGFFLNTDRFDDLYAKLKNAGVLFEEAPRIEPYGTVAVFNDPFGNRWDLLQLNA